MNGIKTKDWLKPRKTKCTEDYMYNHKTQKIKCPKKLTHIHILIYIQIYMHTKYRLAHFKFPFFEYGLIYEIFHHCTKSIVLCQAILLHFQFHFFVFFIFFFLICTQGKVVIIIILWFLDFRFQKQVAYVCMYVCPISIIPFFLGFVIILF